MLATVILLLAAPCTAPQEFRPALCPSGLPETRAVTVARAGVRRWSEPSDPEPCERFRPTPAEMRRYLAQADRVDPQQVHYALPESACIASGTVRFASGKAGRWTVDRFRIATLRIGRAKPLTLYCDRCRFPPFRW